MSSKGSPRSSTLWLVLAAVALWLVWTGTLRRLPLRPVSDSPPAPDLVMRDDRGQELSLGDLRGRIVLLNLWASWCGPCRDEAPRLSRLQRELAGAGVVVLGLNADGLSPEELAEVRERWGVEYTLASATRSLAGTAFEGEGVVPHHWIVDAEGRVRASRAGVLPERSLRRALEELLEEANAAGPSDAVAPFGNAARDQALRLQ